MAYNCTKHEVRVLKEKALKICLVKGCPHIRRTTFKRQFPTGEKSYYRGPHTLAAAIRDN